MMRFLAKIVLGTSALLVAPVAAQTQSKIAIMQALHANDVDAKPEDVSSAVIPSNGRVPTIVLAYVYGHDWCGSSGCWLQVFTEERGKLKPADDYTLWPPITFDGVSRSGHPIIGVWHHGGGILKPVCDEIYLDENPPVETSRQERLETRRCSSAKRVLIDWPPSKAAH